MKICVVTSSFPARLGDTMRASFLVDAVRALRAHGHEVHVLTQGPGESDGFDFPVTHFDWAGQGDGIGAIVQLLTRPVRNGGRILSLLASGTLALRAAHARERFDAVLCCWAVPAGIYARLSGIPYAVWCLGSDINSLKNRPVPRAALRLILRGARARFADGFSLAEDVARISGRACEFLPTFRALDLRAPVSAPSARPHRLLYVGRHDQVKGTDLLIEAFGEIAAEFPQARLKVVGDGPLGPALRERAEKLGILPQVEFPGRVSEAELPSLYREADAVVIPSRSESIPLVLGEAVQAGKPIIATDVGDLGRLVRDYRLGLVVDRPDAKSLASALRELLAGGFAASVPAMRCEAVLDLLSFEKEVPRLIAALQRKETENADR